MAKVVRNLVVQDKQQITPNLTRMILHGNALADFPAGFEGGYVKLLLPQPGAKAVVRSYTVRAFDVALLELTLDMVRA